MTTTLNLPCPAKINLFLRITGRRDDGYHNLQTVFQLLDYGDSLSLTTRDDTKLILESPLSGVDHEDNLIIRAARLLQQRSQCHQGATLKLTKRLPMGGGIGGGSSDAASTLLGLNALWKTGLSLQELSELGATLGADVPVFVLGRSAWAEGVGERLEPIDIPQRHYVVLRPPCEIATREIFLHEQLTRNDPPIKIAAFLEGHLENSCEKLVRKLYPDVDKALIWLNHFAPSKLTGTGSCVFASFENESQARQVFAQRPKQYSGFVAKGVNQSPLHQALALV